MDSRQQHAGTDNARITEQAADWLVELKDAGAATHGEFFEWVRRSPEHVQEFLAVTSFSRRLGQSLHSQQHIDVNALLADSGAEVVRLQRPLPAANRHGKRRLSRWQWSLAASLGAAALIGVFWLAARPETYVTRVGEQRSFTLSDGSLIYLNTNSKAAVQFSKQTREVRLLQGEALFNVEHDPQRPFRVAVGTAWVQAIGTQFNVYRHANAGMTVSVIEGAIELRRDTKHQEPPASSTANAMRLQAGEEADLRPNGRIIKQVLANTDNAIAWRERRLVFDKTPLAVVAAEFNRYNRWQIQVAESATRERQITGVFEADRPESLILFLSKDNDLQIEKRTGQFIIRPRLPGKDD